MMKWMVQRVGQKIFYYANDELVCTGKKFSWTPKGVPEHKGIKLTYTPKFIRDVGGRVPRMLTYMHTEEYAAETVRHYAIVAYVRG